MKSHRLRQKLSAQNPRFSLTNEGLGRVALAQPGRKDEMLRKKGKGRLHGSKLAKSECKKKCAMKSAHTGVSDKKIYQ
jgi:hypothetical protein